MKESVLDILVCPDCRGHLVINQAKHDGFGEIKEGELKCEKCCKLFLIRNYSPRFVPGENYSSSFGFQWHLHAQTQIDKFNGTTITKDRFFDETNWQAQDMKTERILEIGCGAGRFTQVALDTGAICFSVDYSNAVDVCWSNNGPHAGLHLFQANIYSLPFKEGVFDKIFCLGVLQHTPLPKKAFLGLLSYLKKRGEIVIDIYAAPVSWLHPRHILRFFTSRMRQASLYQLVKRMVPWLLPISRWLRRIPFGGLFLARFVPVANYQGVLTLSNKELIEWAILDTFDWLAPRYDRPQTKCALKQWFAEVNLKDVSIKRNRGVYIGKGIKK